MIGMVRETGLFQARSTRTSVSSALTAHWRVIHSLAIQVLFPVEGYKNAPTKAGAFSYGAGNRTFSCTLDARFGQLGSDVPLARHSLPRYSSPVSR